MPESSGNHDVTNAVLAVKLDAVQRSLDKINGRLNDHEVRIRANEINVGKLLTITGGAAGVGSLVGAAIMSLVK